MTLKDRIIHESLRLFSLKGFLSTSVTDILEAASTSKGGFYNHFSSKEDLFLDVLAEAQRIWREKVLYGLEETDNPKDKIKAILLNYRDRYLKDAVNFPGGCVFITFSVELDDQRPHLCAEVNRGYMNFKSMLKRLLEEAKQRGELNGFVDTDAVTEMLFSGMLGSSVIYGAEKSVSALERSIDSLIGYLEQLETDAARPLTLESEGS
jgi:AcrR family transcriptional regulator